MKLILVFMMPFFAYSTWANHCLTIENGVKSLCNNYAKSDAKYVAKQKKICSRGDLKIAGMVITNKFSTGSCSTEGAIAKCSRKGRDMTIYYTGDMADIEKGCKFFKGAILKKF